MKNEIKSNKCVTCKHCLYPEWNDKAYCGQRGDYIDEQYPSCEGYQEVETRLEKQIFNQL